MNQLNNEGFFSLDNLENESEESEEISHEARWQKSNLNWKINVIKRQLRDLQEAFEKQVKYLNWNLEELENDIR
jgi:hypothetical protein